MTVAPATHTFLTDEIASVLVQAGGAAGGNDIALAGGAVVDQQFLRAGLVDEMQLHAAPVLLGGGTRLLDNSKARTSSSSAVA